MTKNSLAKIKKSLPISWGKIIGENTGYSPSMVFKVLSGLRYNKAILEEAIRLASENAEHLEKLEKMAKSL